MKIELDFMKKQTCDECGRNTIVYEFEFTMQLLHESSPHLKLCRDCNTIFRELNK